MNQLWWIALGSGIGGVCRVAINFLVYAWGDFRFPLGTLLVNVVGSLLIGVLARHFTKKGEEKVDERLRHFWTTGFCGGFTTFSTFSLDAWNMLHAGCVLRAVFYVMLTFLLCLIAVKAGFQLKSERS